jgi:hypothetical protein
MKKVTLVLIFCLITISLLSQNIIKIKQKLGSSGYNFYIIHNEESYSTRLLYDSEKSNLSFGFSPLYHFNIKDLVIKFSNYLDLNLNVDEKNWFLVGFQNDTLIRTSFQKWTLYLKLVSLTNKNIRNFNWKGRQFLAYQIFSSCNLRLQTEWSYKETELTSFLGPALEYGISDDLSLGIFLSANTKNSKDKFG